MQNDDTQTYDPVDPSEIDKLLEDGKHIVELGQEVDIGGVPHLIRRIEGKDLVLRPAHWDQMDTHDVPLHEAEALPEAPMESQQALTIYMKSGERFRIGGVIWKLDRVKRHGIQLKPEGRCNIIEGAPVRGKA